MNPLTIYLPVSLRKHLGDVARREGVTEDQFVASAVAEKMSALLTEEYLEARAERGRRDAYDDALGLVPDLAPDPSDVL